MESRREHRIQHPLHEITKTRDQALDLRVKVQASHGKIKHCMRHFDESREAFMTALQNLQAGQIDVAHIEALRNIDDQLREDSDALKSAMGELRDLHYNLSSLDFTLFSEEHKQHGNQGYLDRLLDSGQVAPSTIETMIQAPGSTSDDNDIPPVLEEYFDALGDSKLLRERLDYDLVTEQGERVRHRERRRDQEETLSTTDSEFEASLQRERGDLEAEWEDINKRAAALLSECLQAGYNVDPTAYARQSDNGSSIRDQNKVVQWLDHTDNDGQYLDATGVPEQSETEVIATDRSKSPLQQVDTGKAYNNESPSPERHDSSNYTYGVRPPDIREPVVETHPTTTDAKEHELAAGELELV